MATLYHSSSIADNRDYDQVAELINTVYRKFEIEHGMIGVCCLKLPGKSRCRISGFWKSSDVSLSDRLVDAHPEDAKNLKEEC